MKHIKLFEDFKFKNNNEDGDLITIDDILNCIKLNGVVYSKIIKNLPNNDPDEPLVPLDIDDDGIITIEFDNKEYEVNIKDITKIEM